MTIELVHEFSYWIAVGPAVEFGAGPLGVRTHSAITEGVATGERFNADAVGGGGDWILAGPDGFGRVDVRMQFATHDGARVYVQYLGLLQLDQHVLDALAANTGTDYGDQYFRATPRFETGDPRYAWMNQSVFVSRGRITQGARFEYEVFRVL
jgi:hypothetical protein